MGVVGDNHQLLIVNLPQGLPVREF